MIQKNISEEFSTIATKFVETFSSKTIGHK